MVVNASKTKPTTKKVSIGLTSWRFIVKLLVLSVADLLLEFKRTEEDALVTARTELLISKYKVTKLHNLSKIVWIKRYS